MLKSNIWKNLKNVYLIVAIFVERDDIKATKENAENVAENHQLQCQIACDDDTKYAVEGPLGCDPEQHKVGETVTAAGVFVAADFKNDSHRRQMERLKRKQK